MRLFLVLSVFLSGFLGAQEKVSGLQVRFVAQHLPKGLSEVVAVAGDAVSDPFSIPKNSLSERFKVPARAFRLQTQVGAKLLSKVALPEAGLISLFY